MKNMHELPPDGLKEHTSDWHFSKFVEFTKFKGWVGEPSPHLSMVGHMARRKSARDTAWMLGCYAATYCLPSAQMIWSSWDYDQVNRMPARFRGWLGKNWKGIVTRQERRCVRTPDKMFRCLSGYANWVDRSNNGFAFVSGLKDYSPVEHYDLVWDSVCSVPFIGRYIGIRLIEGLRRFCKVPAEIYDVRSIGGWSPKKALVYMYPKEQRWLLLDTPDANRKTDDIARDLLVRVKRSLPGVNFYIMAAMLCEYKVAFEKRKQYAGRTLDQEPELFDKVKSYWGNDLDAKLFWSTRKALFRNESLGEIHGWSAPRDEGPSKTLRDHGYNWSDVKFNYKLTKDFSDPVKQKT